MPSRSIRLVPLAATSSSTAAPGNFDVKVKSLATGSRIESANNAYTSSSSIVSTTAGKLTFEADGKTFDVNVKATHIDLG